MSYFGPAKYNTSNPFIDLDGLLYYMLDQGKTTLGVAKVSRNMPSRNSVWPHIYLGEKVIEKEFLQTAGKKHQWLYNLNYPIIITAKDFRKEKADTQVRTIMDKLDVYVSERENIYDYPCRLSLFLSTFDNPLLEQAPYYAAPVTATIQYTRSITVLTSY